MINYLYLFVLHGSFIFGHVDSIDGSIALVEVEYEDGVGHKFVFINKKNCVPKEGQAVLLNDYEIIKCL